MKSKIHLAFTLYTLILLISIISLFSIKAKVIRIYRELDSIKEQISQEKDNIQILEAELASLTTPERIKYLSNKYLKLKEIDPKQIIVYNKSGTS